MDVLKVTWAPDWRSSSKVLPAGTVKPLITTVVHLTALATSSREEMVPVQLLARASRVVLLAIGVAETERVRARRREANVSMVNAKQVGTSVQSKESALQRFL